VAISSWWCTAGAEILLKLSPGICYAFAVIAVGVATALRFWLSGVLGPQLFPTFFLAVLLVAVIAGSGPVLLTTFLSALSAVYFFAEPGGAFKLPLTDDLIRLSLFTTIGLSIALMTEATRRAHKKAIEAEVMLAESRARELRESEKRFASFMRHLPGLAWIKDTSGRYFYANDAAVRAFQKSREELYGKADEEIFDEGTASQFRMNDKKALLSDTGVTAVETLKHDDGVIHHSLVSKFAIPDGDGAAKGIGGVAIDITERVEMEERLREATEKLKEADQRKDEFIATLAHELRNPLAAAYNATYALSYESSKVPKAQRELDALAIVERQLHHLVRLVDDLVEVSRISAGKIRLKIERVNLADVLRHAVETAQPAIERAGHVLTMQIPVASLFLDGDPVRLAQIFANLLNNAAKYTDSGGAISLAAERSGDQAIITVSDNGIGISPAMLPRVFDLFAQEDRRGARAQGGLGIGLGLVKHLVELHGGDVEAHSDGVGHGSAFIVRLQLANEEQPLPTMSRTTAALRSSGV
jgi:PAS domain S-box-containing protein